MSLVLRLLFIKHRLHRTSNLSCCARTDFWLGNKPRLEINSRLFEGTSHFYLVGPKKTHKHKHICVFSNYHILNCCLCLVSFANLRSLRNECLYVYCLCVFWGPLCNTNAFVQQVWIPSTSQHHASSFSYKEQSIIVVCRSFQALSNVFDCCKPLD